MSIFGSGEGQDALSLQVMYSRSDPAFVYAVAASRDESSGVSHRLRGRSSVTS